MGGIFSYNSVAVALLALIGICQIGLLLCAWTAARHLDRTCQQMQKLLPHFDPFFRKSRQTFELSRQLLTRGNRLMGEMEGIFHKACGAVSETVEQFLFLKGKAQGFLAKQFGNGQRVRIHPSARVAVRRIRRTV